MRLLVKTFATLVILLLLILSGGFMYLTQVLDPNEFKADIEAAAQQQGVPLRLHGDIAWRFFPQLGLRVEQVELATAGASLLRAEELAASVAVMPLLQGQLQVAGVLLKGARIHALRDAQGRVNWELSAATGESDKSVVDNRDVNKSATADNRKPLTLAIEQLRIEDAHVLFEDQQAGARSQLENWNLNALNINFDGQPFSLKQDFVVRLDELPALIFHSQGEMRLDAKAGVLDIPSLLLTVATLEAPSETIQLRLTGASALEPLTPDFHLSLAPMNVAAWLAALNIERPPMAAVDALTHLSLEADLSGANQAWQLSNLAIQLDKTSLQGSVVTTQDGGVTLQLKGDQLNVDRYLPPTVAGDQQASTIKPAASDVAVSPLLSSETLSLDGLKALTLNADLTLQQLQLSGLAITDASLSVQANAGDVHLEQLSASLYEGRLSLAGRLDARQPMAKVSGKGELTSLSLAPLLEALALQSGEQSAGEEPEPTLAGQANIAFDLTSSGQSLRDWQLGLKASAKLLANQLTVHQLDVEKGFCELAASLSGKGLVEQSWKGLTNLDDVSVDLALLGTEVTIKKLQAGVEHFQLKGRGESNYLKGDFDIEAEALVGGQEDVTRGCQLADRWRDRELPLRCAGNFDSIGARTCGPDKARVDDLLRDEAKARAKEKVGNKINKLEDKLKKKLGDDIGGKLFKGLFNR